MRGELNAAPGWSTTSDESVRSSRSSVRMVPYQMVSLADSDHHQLETKEVKPSSSHPWRHSLLARMPCRYWCVSSWVMRVGDAEPFITIMGNSVPPLSSRCRLVTWGYG